MHRPADPWARSADRAACPPLLSSGPVLAAALAMASRWCGHPGADGDGPGHNGGPEPHQPGRRHGAPHLSHGRAASATRLRAHRALRGRCSSRALRVPWDDQTIGSCECARPQRVPGSAACAGLQPGLGAGRQRPCLRCRPRPQDSAILVETRDVEGNLRLVREGHHDGAPYTGWAHQAQGRTGCPCRRPPRVAFALGPPFRRSTGVTPPTRPGLGMPPAHTGGRTPLPWASQRYAGHRADAHDPRKGGLPISWLWSVAYSAGGKTDKGAVALSHRWLWEATSDHRLSDDPPRARLHVPVVGDGRQRPSPSIEPPLSRRHDRARKARLAVRWRARACRRSAPLPLQTTPRCRRRATGT